MKEVIAFFNASAKRGWTGLALLHIHRDIDVNVDNVIDRFGKSKSKKRRHLDFVIR